MTELRLHLADEIPDAAINTPQAQLAEAVAAHRRFVTQYTQWAQDDAAGYDTLIALCEHHVEEMRAWLDAHAS